MTDNIDLLIESKLNNIGPRIKGLRELNNMSQEDLEEKSGISRRNIGYLEQGRTNPKLATLVKLADAFNMSVSEFLDY